MNLRRLVLHSLLSLLLLWAQQAGFAHALAHRCDRPATASVQAPGAQQDTLAAGDSHFCDKCLALAQCGAPVGSAALRFAAPAPVFPAHAQSGASAPHRLILQLFESRAPPPAPF